MSRTTAAARATAPAIRKTVKLQRVSHADNCERVRQEAEAHKREAMLCEISIALAYAIRFKGLTPGSLNRDGEPMPLVASGLKSCAVQFTPAVREFQRQLDLGCFWTKTDELGPPSMGALPSPFATLELVAVPAALAGQTAIVLRHSDGTLFQIA